MYKANAGLAPPGLLLEQNIETRIRNHKNYV